MRERESNTDVSRFGWTSRTGEGSGQPPRTCFVITWDLLVFPLDRVSLALSSDSAGILLIYNPKHIR